jgi:hypothetical protein
MNVNFKIGVTEGITVASAMMTDHQPSDYEVQFKQQICNTQSQLII